MSVKYEPILWNKQKRIYDTIIVLFCLLFLTVFFGANKILYPQVILPTLLIRGFGLLAIVLLHVILSIGPLTRLFPKLMPLLYNRRHLGVTMFLVASIHAIVSLVWFHGNGNVNPFISLFTSNTHYNSFLFFPFQTLGFFAYVVLMIMAFTSHDFWLAALSPRVWKFLHMLVYLAYFVLIMHVMLGVIQLENNFYVFLFLILGMVWLFSLHLIAGYKEFKFDRIKPINDKIGWVRVCSVLEIEENRAKMVNVTGERVAVFKYDGKLSAVHNVCKHQNGPLGEGKIVDGCITCPWHGYQYKPHDGCSPAPFTEKLATYELKLIEQEIYVNPDPLPEGTPVSPLLINYTPSETKDEFYIGWLGTLPKKYSKSFKWFVFPSAIIGLLFLLVFTLNQNNFSSGKFNYDEPVEITGTLFHTPFTYLSAITGKDEFGNPVFKIYPLINARKFGADAVVDEWCNIHKKAYCHARIKGTIIEREGGMAFELSEGILSLTEADETDLEKEYRNDADTISCHSSKWGNCELIGDTILMGEIVDPKCYLGAMNPGEGKPHRDCAIRCISGGITPAFTFFEKGVKKYAMLTGFDGEKINDRILFAVAEPVTIRGRLYKFNNWYWLETSPENIVRLAN